MSNLHPDELLLMLKNGADQRRVKSLDILHKTLREYVAQGGDDFSIRTIGKLSEVNGGPKEQSIRNATGAAFKDLIMSWEAYARTNSPKISEKKDISISKNNSSNSDLLKQIEDPALRALIGIIFSERDLYFKENRLLKQQTEITYDKRANKESMLESNTSPKILQEYEIETLKNAISDDFFAQQGWTTDKNGRVFNGKVRIYGLGYVTAIKKIIGTLE